MRARLLALGLSVLVLGGISTPPTPAIAAETAAPPRSPEERAVVAVFDQARTALERKDGAAVVPLLSHGSIGKLEAIRDAARGGESGISRMQPAEKFAAMGLRHYVKPAELRRMSLAQLADHGIRQKWLGPNVLAGAALGPVRVRGDHASALLMVDNRPALVPADFVREGGRWRIDLGNVFTYGSALLTTGAAIAGKSDEAFIADLLAKLPVGRGR